jgi:hypothetical protein
MKALTTAAPTSLCNRRSMLLSEQALPRIAAKRMTDLIEQALA